MTGRQTVQPSGLLVCGGLKHGTPGWLAAAHSSAPATPLPWWWGCPSSPVTVQHPHQVRVCGSVPGGRSVIARQVLHWYWAIALFPYPLFR
jgi:hypothetical protein